MNEKIQRVINEYKKRTEKPCYEIKLLDMEANILDDKIGGNPYLPVGEEYPKDKDGNCMPLLLQVNLKNIDLDGYPKKGILEIFTDKDVDYPCQYEVRYYDEGLEYQTDFEDIDRECYIVNSSYKILLNKTISHMSINDYRAVSTVCNIVNDLYGTNFNDYNELESYFGDFDWFYDMMDELEIPLCCIGGYADFTQTDPRDYQNINKDECLFKLDSTIDEDKVYIGDAGILFALISKEDIENCNFSNTLVDWDCC